MVLVSKNNLTSILILSSLISLSLCCTITKGNNYTLANFQSINPEITISESGLTCTSSQINLLYSIIFDDPSCNQTGTITLPCVNKNWNFNATSPCVLSRADETVRLDVKIRANFSTPVQNHSCYQNNYIYIKWGKGSPDPAPKPDPQPSGDPTTTIIIAVVGGIVVIAVGFTVWKCKNKRKESQLLSRDEI